tara:strand:- start:5373 stop:5552 length:180 start_codon:yes stop_codon:yes gene_type:complete
MKVFSIIFSMAGFFLMMAGVGTIEADNSITGIELAIWGLIVAIGILTWISGIILWRSQR